MVGPIGGATTEAVSGLVRQDARQQTALQRTESERVKTTEETSAGQSVESGLRTGESGDTLSAGVTQTFGTDSESFDPNTPRGTLVNLFA